jgi:aerobic-type carbon monoxide dehydrogenase small subunit (CoxS/CutS family)
VFNNQLTRNMNETISFTLNGTPLTLDEGPDRPLLWVLRTEYGLNGTKYGCGEGHCGSCRVLIDNEALPSCQLTLWDVNGRSVTTIEGLSKNGILHPVQQAFIDEEAFQCGYCTPGMILTAIALLRKNTMPSEAEILDVMDGNLCRCGSYLRIVQAVQSAATLIKEKG